MAEYIEKNIAMVKLTNLEVTDSLATMTDAKRVLADIPAVDVAPVVHGKWVENEGSCHYDYYLTYFDFNCSVCGEVVNDKHGLPNYCPNCGAKMEER